jgi:hypothetical protein
MKQETINIFSKLILSLATISFLISCTSKKNDEIKDQALAKNLVAISDLRGDFGMTLGEQEQPLNARDKVDAAKVSTQVLTSKVASSQLPPIMNMPVQRLKVPGKTGENFKIRFSIKKESDVGFVTAYKIVPNKENLSVIERHIVEQDGDFSLIVPTFQIKIVKAGVLIKKKNENKEDTNEIILEETTLDKATHLQLDLDNGVSAVIPSIDKNDENREYFSTRNLENRVFKIAELNQLLQIDLGYGSKNADKNVVIKLAAKTPGAGSEKTKLLVYEIKAKADIVSPELLEEIENPKSESLRVMKCPSDVLSQIDPGSVKDCYLVQIARIPVQLSVAQRSTKNGIPTADIEFKPSTRNSGLVKVSRGTEFENVEYSAASDSSSDSGGILCSPKKCFAIDDMKDKEFFYRRTFQDASSAIQAMGPGSSGEMALVKFEFNSDKLIVRRALTINGNKHNDPSEREVLMSLPAKYLKTKNSKGELLNMPLITNFENADTIKVNFLADELKPTLSPLSYFADGRCFDDSANIRMSDVDNRLSDGIFNFTIEGTYQFKMGCASSWTLNQYFWDGGFQLNFEVKERVSFMRNSGVRDNKANQNIPIQAQNMLGFGVFTASKLKQDEFGRLNRIGTEIAQPIIQDFTNGRQLVYVLGGLPKTDDKMGDLVIEATKSVVKDWNDKLRLAFKGTELERKTDYILLSINGVDVPEGQLGDLDRNYIWAFEKANESGFLGLAQISPNPRSGFAESSNVLMAAGGLMEYIGSQIEIAEIRARYKNLREQAIAELSKPQPASPEASNDSIAPKVSSSPDDLNMKFVLNYDKKKSSPNESTEDFVKELIEKSKFDDASITPILANAKSGTNFNLANVKKYVTEQKENYLLRIFEKATRENLGNDINALNALTASEVLSAYGNRLSPIQKQVLQASARELTLIAEFDKNFRKGPNCITRMNEQVITLPNGMSLDKYEIFKVQFASVLSHELGHTLGLTHNFRGSTDKNNFAFKGENSKRNYSSIMDYMPIESEKFDGAGPYDVFAIRAAYTGQIETVNGQFLSLKEIEASAKARANKIKNEQEKKSVLEGYDKGFWWVSNSLNIAPELSKVKSFNYCTDMHVGSDPLCNRWDMGSSAFEIAQYYVSEYLNNYAATNDRGNRINFSSYDRYISKLFYQMLQLKNFMDEAFYRLIVTNKFSKDVEDLAYASIFSMNHLLQIVTTPNTNEDIYSTKRFSAADITVPGPDGKPVSRTVLVEAKSHQSKNILGSDYEAKTLGIEYDKNISLLVLSQKGSTNPHLQSLGVSFSFADFEKLILGRSGTESFILATLKNIITGNGVALYNYAGIEPAMLPESIKPQETESVNYYSILAASVFLESPAIDEKANLASNFRIGSSVSSVPEGLLAVTKLDNSTKSKSALKLWAFDNATLGLKMIAEVATLRYLVENTEAIKKAGLGTLVSEAATAEEKAKAQTDIMAFLTKLQSEAGLMFLFDQAEQRGLTLNDQVDDALKINAVLAKTAKGLVQQIRPEIEKQKLLEQDGDDKIKAAIQSIFQKAKFSSVIAKQIEQVETLSIENPMILSVNKITTESVADRLEKIMLEVISPSAGQLETRHGVTLRKLEILNKFVYSVNPELKQ